MFFSGQLDTARSDASVASWLFTVARTVLADHWRRYYRDPQSTGLNDEIMAEQPTDQLSTSGSRATEHMVEAVLQGLPARYRRVLELRFLHGYTVDEAAREMGVTAGNLKVLQHRALARAASIGMPDRDVYEVRGSFPQDTSPSVTPHDHTGEEHSDAHQVSERNMT
jgi:RNA polymerase sigma factor (sigma-70 family)